MARELHGTLLQLTGWADRNRVTIAESRAAYDEARGLVEV